MADSRIPMMGRPIQLNSPLNMLARVQGLDNMRQTNALNAMQMQDAQAQRAAQAQASQARQQALAQLPPPPPDAPPEWHQMHRAVVTGLASPKDYFDLVTKPKPDRKLTVVGNTAIDPNTGQPVYSAPEKPEKVNPNQPFMMVDGEVVPNVRYQDYQRSLKERPASPSAAVAPTVQVPKLKPGERWNATDERVEAVPGSDLYQTQSGKHAKDDAALRGVETKMDTAIKKIQGLLDPKNKDAFESNFGGYGAYATQYLPGKASDTRKTIESIKSDLKAAGLEMMRSGGSIGQMTQQEWPIVERMITAIDPVLGEETARQELGKVITYMQSIKDNARAVYETEWGGTQFAKKAAGQNPKPPDGGAKPDGTDLGGGFTLKK